MINLISIILPPACLTEVNLSTTLMAYGIDGEAQAQHARCFF